MVVLDAVSFTLSGLDVLDGVPSFSRSENGAAFNKSAIVNGGAPGLVGLSDGSDVADDAFSDAVADTRRDAVSGAEVDMGNGSFVR